MFIGSQCTKLHPVSGRMHCITATKRGEVFKAKPCILHTYYMYMREERAGGMYRTNLFRHRSHASRGKRAQLRRWRGQQLWCSFGYPSGAHRLPWKIQQSQETGHRHLHDRRLHSPAVSHLPAPTPPVRSPLDDSRQIEQLDSGVIVVDLLRGGERERETER